MLRRRCLPYPPAAASRLDRAEAYSIATREWIFVPQVMMADLDLDGFANGAEVANNLGEVSGWHAHGSGIVLVL